MCEPSHWLPAFSMQTSSAARKLCPSLHTLPSHLAQSHRLCSTTSCVMAAVQVVQLPPAFWGEQAVYGPHYRGGLAPPPDWWAQAAQACALSQYQVAALQQLFQPCRWQTVNGFSYQPVQAQVPMMQMATPHYTSPAPPTPGPSPTQQALPQPQAFHPAPAASIPTSAPTSSPKSPAQPSWADMSEDLAPPSLREALPTLLPKPNKGSGKGKGKGKTAKKSSKGTGRGRNGGKWHEEYSDYSWNYQGYQYCGWY